MDSSDGNLLGKLRDMWDPRRAIRHRDSAKSEEAFTTSLSMEFSPKIQKHLQLLYQETSAKANQKRIALEGILSRRASKDN